MRGLTSAHRFPHWIVAAPGKTMRKSVLERTQLLPRPIDEVFEFFSDPQNLAAITPPWLRFRIVSAPAKVQRGALIGYRLRLKGVPVRWLTEITEWQPPRSFTDVQVAGPYRLWEHTHRLASCGDETEMYDHILYAVPGGQLGPALDRAVVRPLLDEIFDYRAERVRELVERR
jgi:ligand-binding SRPBCC domain-containing protein